jgi:transposase
MRPPAHLESWLSSDGLALWVREAPDKASYQKRLAVWLTFLQHPAHEVADLLQVSIPAVWLWVKQYNQRGPEGLIRQGRGGRRWSFLSVTEEEKLLASWEVRALRGEVLTAAQLQPEVEAKVGKPVSRDYVDRLLHRNQWRKLGPRPRHVKANPQAQEEFKKNSRKLSGRKPTKPRRG